jgi:gentisate 1,2-dioxygenase
VPLTHLLEPMFFEEHPQGFAPVTNTNPESPMRFTWESTQDKLRKGKESEFFGRTIELPAPTMPTILLKVHAWAKGWQNKPYRHSANVVLVVMKGEGYSVINGQRFDWNFGDTLAIPAWSRIEHHASADCVIFDMSDEALMRWTRYYRFEALS